MSAPSTGFDFPATLRLMGLPVAGTVLQGQAADATQSFMESLDEKYNAQEAMDQFAHSWVTFVVGEEMLNELPDSLDFDQLQTVVAAAWKKVQPSEREQTLSTVSKATIVTLQSKRRLRESLTRRSEPRTSASPAPTRLSVQPYAVVSAQPMMQPMMQLGMVQSTVQVALQPTVLPSREQGQVVAVRTHHPRCPRCNKRESKCLCSSLHAPPLAPRGEVEGSSFLVRTEIPGETPPTRCPRCNKKDTKCLCSSLHAPPLTHQGEVGGSSFLARTAPAQVPRHTGKITSSADRRTGQIPRTADRHAGQIPRTADRHAGQIPSTADRLTGQIPSTASGPIQRIHPQHKDCDPSALSRIQEGSRSSLHQSLSSHSDDSSSQPKSDPRLGPLSEPSQSAAMFYMPKLWRFTFQSGKTEDDLRTKHRSAAASNPRIPRNQWAKMDEKQRAARKRTYGL